MGLYLGGWHALLHDTWALLHVKWALLQDKWARLPFLYTGTLGRTAMRIVTRSHACTGSVKLVSDIVKERNSTAR